MRPREESGLRASEGLFLKTLLLKAHGAASKEQFACLPSLYREKLEKASLKFPEVSSRTLNPLSLVESGGSFLPKMHYSWLIAPLRQLSRGKRKLITLNLTDKQKNGLRRMFKDDLSGLSSPFFHYLLQGLISDLDLNNHLPLEFLPENPSKKLLQFSKEELISIIDYLALYDLAVELRSVIANEQLKTLFSFLTKDQQTFLIKCMKKHDRFTASKLSLDKWKGSKEELFKQLHIRGLIRLSLALSGEHPDLPFYLSRILDTGRGGYLLRYTKPHKIEPLTPAALVQLNAVIHHLFGKGLS